jgi:hypothetical protein
MIGNFATGIFSGLGNAMGNIGSGLGNLATGFTNDAGNVFGGIFGGASPNIGTPGFNPNMGGLAPSLGTGDQYFTNQAGMGNMMQQAGVTPYTIGEQVVGSPQQGGIFGNLMNGSNLFGTTGAIPLGVGIFSTMQQMRAQEEQNKLAKEMMRWQQQQYEDRVRRERAYMRGQIGDRATNRQYAYEDGNLVKSSSAFANESPGQAAARYGL